MKFLDRLSASLGFKNPSFIKFYDRIFLLVLTAFYSLVFSLPFLYPAQVLNVLKLMALCVMFLAGYVLLRSR